MAPKSPLPGKQVKTQDETWLAGHLVPGQSSTDNRKGHWKRWLAPPSHPTYSIRMAELRRILAWPTYIVRIHIESWSVGRHLPQVERASKAKLYRYHQGGRLPEDMHGMEYQP